MLNPDLSVGFISLAKHRQSSLRYLFYYVVLTPPIILLGYVYGLIVIWSVPILLTVIYAARTLVKLTPKPHNRFWFLWLGPLVELKGNFNFFVEIEKNPPEWVDYLTETFKEKDYYIVVYDKSKPVVKFRHKTHAILFKLVYG